MDGLARHFLAFVCFLSLISNVAADDLYHVPVSSPRAARVLATCPARPVLRVSDGYLILGDAGGVAAMRAVGLAPSLVASDVGLGEMAIDIRPDLRLDRTYPVIYEDAGPTLVRLDRPYAGDPNLPPGLVPLRSGHMPIVYVMPAGEKTPATYDPDYLDSLVSRVNVDSLESYAHALEGFYRRVTGTSGAYLCRDWLVARLTGFGYDSVVVDSFQVYVSDILRTGYNVIACKTGTTYPLHRIIIGAHRDAVPGSPGADDNGSGVCALLEIARLMSDRDTKLSFAFAFFDAEEQGLIGAWECAAAAADNRDSIALMLNMDMIANYECDSTARIFHGLDTAYSELWAELADTLPSIGLTVEFNDGSAGDDLAFEQCGYKTVGIHEGVFSPFYHSSQDSACYLNYDYEARMARATLATAIVVDESYPVQPMISFAYPNGLPSMTYPGLPTELAVELIAYAGDELVVGTGQLHYRVNGGDFVTTELTGAGGSMYQGTIPPLVCSDMVEYYFSAEGTSGGTVYDPQPDEPMNAYAATSIVTVFSDDFEADEGWVVTGDATSGEWTRAWPAYSLGWWDAPSSDYDHSGLCYQTDEQLGLDLDNGTTILTSPSLDLSVGRPLIQYARWFSNEEGGEPYTDVMDVMISNDDGQTWELVERLGPVENASGGWGVHRFWTDEIVAPSASMRLRFIASDLAGDSHVEAAVDAVSVISYLCVPVIVSERMPDWTVGIPYEQQLLAAGGTGQFAWSDIDYGLAGSGLNLAASGLLQGTPTSTGSIYFLAEAIDSAGAAAQKPFVIEINPPPEIVEASLPGAVVDQPYSYQYTSAGGTGIGVWQEAGGVLSGLGLELSSDGAIAGTPSDTGVFEFTVRVTDEVGAWAETTEGLWIHVGFVCGDINGDGSTTVDVADLVYLVTYMFQSGPPPPIMAAADVNGDGAPGPDITDLVYLVTYMFQEGPAPTCP